MKSSIIISVFVTACCSLTYSSLLHENIHQLNNQRYYGTANGRQLPDYEDAEFWVKSAQDALKKKLNQDIPIKAQAKNLILYLGDGMSAPTITASRIFKGQKVDNLPFGEEAELHMETLSFTGVSKTFCSDAQTADSACTSTAYLCGSKGNIGTVGVTPAVKRGDCLAQSNPLNQVSSVLAWAQAAGKSTGVVARSKVTDASPSGAYAHIADRDWENDAEIRASGGDPDICQDIAKQLIMGTPGNKINVILGGGRRQFRQNTTADPEYPDQMGYRQDGLDLIDIWRNTKNGSNIQYVTAKDELLRVNTTELDYLLGLFAPGDMGYLDQQEKDNDPSLEEMTQVAIEILSKNPNGFFLFVEGSNIDSAHHNSYAQRAFWETIELDKAIKKGDELTANNETLIVVTSDHAHVLSIQGTDRGNSILEIAELAADGLPYSALSYANGPGPAVWLENGTRRNITGDDFHAIDYRQPSPIPRTMESHGADDVLIMAKGPYAHLLTGFQQQSYIPHVMAYAACIGSGAQHCTK